MEEPESTSVKRAGPAPRSLQWLAALSSLACAFAVAGCEEEERLSKAQYEQKVRSVYGDVQTAFRAVGADAKTLDDFAAQLGDAQEELREAAEQLEKVEPPKAVEEENEELVEGMREYADDLDELREAAEKGNSARVTSLRGETVDSPAIEQMAEAAEEMMQRGYDLGPLQAE